MKKRYSFEILCLLKSQYIPCIDCGCVRDNAELRGPGGVISQTSAPVISRGWVSSSEEPLAAGQCVQVCLPGPVTHQCLVRRP